MNASVIYNPSKDLGFHCRFSESQFHIQVPFKLCKTMMAASDGTTRCSSVVPAESTVPYPGRSHVRHTLFCYAVFVSQLTCFGNAFQYLYVHFAISFMRNTCQAHPYKAVWTLQHLTVHMALLRSRFSTSHKNILHVNSATDTATNCANQNATFLGNEWRFHCSEDEDCSRLGWHNLVWEIRTSVSEETAAWDLRSSGMLCSVDW
jgi:hypothetical protein